MFTEGSGYLDDGGDDDDDNNDNDNGNENNINNGGYNDIISSYKSQNSSDSTKKSSETYQVQLNSGRLLSTHSSQLLPSRDINYAYRQELRRKGVHVDNDGNYNHRNSDNHRALFLFLIACFIL
ncbi:unnamed protein product [Cercopithifilaria johnstoni]|uniref:Uncharacterized protein n=1 Tax=Cercopithifilaria johnstoni TaxID=2874296 RepID=A0A8J2Q668_9BILA|nr:unnamed protein product [Cercopithifilaria johnstoni]